MCIDFSLFPKSSTCPARLLYLIIVTLQVSPVSCCFLPLRPRYFPQNYFPERGIPSLTPIQSCTQNYSLVLILTKDSWSIGSKYSPNLICLFFCECDWLFSVVSKYYNFPTFSEVLFTLCFIFISNIHFIPICVWVCRSNGVRYNKRSRVRFPSFYLVRINEVCNKLWRNTLCTCIYTLSCNTDKLYVILTWNIF